MVYEEIIKWHEIITRPPTQEELEEFKEIYAEDPEYVFDCTMPDDGQDILVVSYWGIDIDTCVIDDYGYGLEEHGDWDGIDAWAEMPKYKAGEQDE